MNYHFVKMNPSGNTTILITSPTPQAKYKDISIKIMKEASLCAEQVGFIVPPINDKAIARLEMMGGEFCGNGSRCLAAWIALGGLKGDHPTGFINSKESVPIEVSGNDGILTAEVTNSNKINACHVAIEMPKAIDIYHYTNETLGEHSLVVYKGIIHIILWDVPADSKYIDIVHNYLTAENLDDSCFGIMFFNTRASSVVPLVYVKEVNSLVWEKSCGSGTVAIASAIAHKEKRSVENLRISQPGGNLFADVQWEGKIKKACLKGDITIAATGTVYVD